MKGLIMSKEDESNLKNFAIGAGLHETVSRHGLAGAEFLKGLRGIDNETGQIFKRNLIKIAEGKLNPEYLESNLKQQAGYAAEVAGVSRKNAQFIIEGKNNRFIRSDDLSSYGANHNIVDIVELLDGREVSTSQMKFVENTDLLLTRIAQGEGGGKNDLSRYMNVDKLDVPTEQVEHMKATCRERAAELRQQAQRTREIGKIETAEKLQKQADNYQKLEKKISNSGLSTEQAIQYRLNPKLETLKDIAGVSHKAAMEGAKFGAAIGGGISAVANVIAVCSGNKEFGDAVVDTAKDSLISAGVGYGTAFTGTAIKTYMQQSTSSAARAIAQTGMPAMVVSACLASGKSIIRYAKGEIDEYALTEEMSMTAMGMLSGSAFTALGQLAIPIPVVGGLIGGMVGYALASSFHQNFYATLKDAQLSVERRQIVEMQCTTAQALAQQYEQRIKYLFDKKLAQLNQESRAMFAALDDPNISDANFCAGMNKFAELLGKKISINNLAELDAALHSDEPLII